MERCDVHVSWISHASVQYMGDVTDLTTQIHSMKMKFCCSRKQNQTKAILSFAPLRQRSAVDYPKC